MEKADKPKNVILLERDYSSNEEIVNKENVNQGLAKKLATLFNGHFCDWESDEDKLNKVLIECLKNLLEAINYKEDYSSFRYKDLNKEINSYILIYTDKSLQNKFMDLLLKTKYFFNYNKIKDNFYEIKYEKTLKDNTKLSFKILLKLVNNDYFDDSECNIFLYDINDDESYNSIKNLIRRVIETNGPKFKKIYELFSLNTNKNLEDEINDKIKKGKNLAYEIGLIFHY